MNIGLQFELFDDYYSVISFDAEIICAVNDATLELSFIDRSLYNLVPETEHHLALLVLIQDDPRATS